jgi:hypothetical protein
VEVAAAEAAEGAAGARAAVVEEAAHGGVAEEEALAALKAVRADKVEQPGVAQDSLPNCPER